MTWSLRSADFIVMICAMYPVPPFIINVESMGPIPHRGHKNNRKHVRANVYYYSLIAKQANYSLVS